MLRDFQSECQSNCFTAWGEGAVNVMLNMPTGGGKTVTFTDTIEKFDVPACVIAHRQELVSQACLALNRAGIPHSIIAPDKVIKEIIAVEREEHEYSKYSSRANVRVAGVDSIIKLDGKERWFSQVGLVVQDEGHHVLRENKWGAAQLMFPNARGLFPTAHAVRADGAGLGREADGLVDKLVIGPAARFLINRGYLTDYRLVCVKADVDFDAVPVGPSGEVNMPTLRAVTHSSKQLVGDVVREYLKWAPGKLGVTFAVDVEEATKLRNAYQAAGVPAEVITAKTPITVRSKLMKKFRRREILQLVSVDCLGEGVDVPAIEVVSLARRTASWQLLCQQVGRALRVIVGEEYAKHWGEYTDEQRLAIIAASPKPKAIIIDHVGNILYHAKTRGLPCSPQEYYLERRAASMRGKSDAIPMRVCVDGVDKLGNPAAGCFQPYERFYIACPHCGVIPNPAGRGSIELVEGDLGELDPTVLAALRGEVDRINGPLPNMAGMAAAAQRGIIRSHHDRYTAQKQLQRVMQVWGGWQLQLGRTDREMQKLFYIRFGKDVMSAQTLGATDAVALETKIRAELMKYNIVEANAA